MLQDRWNIQSSGAVYDPALEQDLYVKKDGYLERRDSELFSNMLRATDFVLAELKKTTDSLDAELIVVYMPVYYGDVLVKIPPEIAASGRRRGIPIIDTTIRMNDYISRGRGEELIVPKDGHFSALVHKTIADEIARVITKGYDRAASGDTSQAVLVS